MLPSFPFQTAATKCGFLKKAEPGLSEGICVYSRPPIIPTYVRTHLTYIHVGIPSHSGLPHCLFD